MELTRSKRVNSTWRRASSSAHCKALVGPDEPWYLATTLPTIQATGAWYRQRCWIEESFKDDKGRVLLDAVRVESTTRLNRLLMALTMAISWLALIGLPDIRILPRNWNAAVVTRDTASFIHQALVFPDDC